MFAWTETDKIEGSVEISRRSIGSILVAEIEDTSGNQAEAVTR